MARASNRPARSGSQGDQAPHRGGGERGGRVLIVEDHQLFAEALAPLLSENGWEVLEPASDGARALAAVRSVAPDIVLIDLVLPDMDGVELGRRILEIRPDTKVVALTALSQPRAVHHAIEAGFHGYLTKGAPLPQLIKVIGAVLDGQVVLPHGLLSPAPQRQSAEQHHAEIVGRLLTRREYMVLELLVEGSSTREMAHRLGVSPNTVRTHIQNVLSKLQVSSRLEAAAFAVRHRLLAPYPRASGG